MRKCSVPKEKARIYRRCPQKKSHSPIKIFSTIAAGMVTVTKTTKI